ncbi:hypothetical protein BT69DRAFT_1182147, partial [Atractiella rhizophila]
LLDFVEVHGEHSGKKLAKLVYDVLTRLRILEKIHICSIRSGISVIVSDNASSNDTMMEELELLFAKDGIPFPAAERKGKCLPHIVHLA